MNYDTQLADLWLCLDCTQEAEGNPRIMSGNLLTPNWGESGEGSRDYSREQCGLCNSNLFGYRHRFALWGN